MEFWEEEEELEEADEELAEEEEEEDEEEDENGCSGVVVLCFPVDIAELVLDKSSMFKLFFCTFGVVMLVLLVLLSC